MLELMANIMANMTIMTMNHIVMGVRSWLEKDGENAMIMLMTSVGRQLMRPHRISVNLLGGLMTMENVKLCRIYIYITMADKRFVFV